MTRRSAAWLVLGLALNLVVWTGDATAQSWRTVTRSRQAVDAEPVAVHVKYGAGRFEVRPTESGVLYRMELTYDEEGFEPLARFRSGRLELGIEGGSGKIKLGSDDNRSRLDLELGRGVPMDLHLEFGAVRADLDLGGLTMTNLLVSTGASETRVDISEPNAARMDLAEFNVGVADFTAHRLGNLNADVITVDAGVGSLELDFSGQWQRDGEINVDMGLGSLELRFPESVGIRLDKDTFLTSLDAEGMTKRGGVFYSSNWESADIQIRVNVDAAFGSIRISRTR